jgi:uridylate kinase
MEIGAEVLMKATKVDGVYDSDPVKNPSAKKFEKISYIEVLNRGLKVMDLTAVSLCMDNELPILSFDMTSPGNILRAAKGESIGTLIVNS